MSTNPVRTRPLPVVTPRNSKTTTHCKLSVTSSLIFGVFSVKKKKTYIQHGFLHIFWKYQMCYYFFTNTKTHDSRFLGCGIFFARYKRTFQTFSSGVVDLHRVPVITQMIFFSDFTKQSMQVTVSIIFESSPLDYNLNFTKQTSQWKQRVFDQQFS